MKLKFRCEEVSLHVVYRSPNSIKENDDALCKWFKEMAGINILIGDFNLPDVDWQNGKAGSRGREFLELRWTYSTSNTYDSLPTQVETYLISYCVTEKE